jgi:hypothetical protein
MLKPNLAIHIPVGDIYIPACGLSEDVYVKTDGREYVRLDSYRVERILKELGVEVERSGWASWEKENWKIDGNYIVFHGAVGLRTDRPKRFEKRIRKEEAKRTLLLLKCPFWSRRERKIVLKNCRGCCFCKTWDGYECMVKYAGLEPLREMIRNHVNNYVYVEKYRDYDYGYIAASLNFTIENEKVASRLIDGLFSNYNVSETENGYVFKRHYALSDRPVKYYIVIKGVEGFIRAEESGECWSYEDWQNLTWYLSDKKNHVLKAFAEICYRTHGKVKPEYHGKGISYRFRKFTELIQARALNQEEMERGEA